VGTANDRRLSFAAGETAGPVSALFRVPSDPASLLLLGHGAGAGMEHPFMTDLAQALGEAGVATLRYQFPYMERGTRRPDPRPVLLKTVRRAVDCARSLEPGLPLVAGGKSMGGRMTSMAAAQEALPGVRGLVFFGFPLHPAGSSGVERAEHLQSVTIPLLFIQGTRDRLAQLELLRPIVDRLPGAALHVIEGADHGFSVLKRSGRDQWMVLHEIAATAAHWIAHLPEDSSV